MPKLNLTDLAIQRLKPEEKGTRYFDDQLPGFGILVGAKAKTFIVMHGRERKVTSLGRYPDMTLKEARQEAKRILADPTAPKARKTYAEAVEAYLKARKPHVKAVTYQHYAYYLNALAFKGNLADLTKADIKKGLEQWEGKKRAQNACFAALKSCLNWAVQEEIIDHHPINRTRVPNKTPSRDRVLTDDEIVTIWRHTDHKPYGWLWRLALLTGARKMELRNLVVEGDYITFKATKNKTDHSLPITPLIRAHLIPQPYKFDNYEREKRRLDAKVKIPHYTLHDARRTAASVLARIGGTVTSDHIEALLNHKQDDLKATYQRWSYMPEIKNCLLTLEAHIVKILTAQGINPEPSTAPLGAEDEDTEQARA
jgi:integrase